MEYLPEKRRTQKTQVMKKEKKIREFRNYLADEQIVLSLTKCKCMWSINNIVSVNSFGGAEKPAGLARGPVHIHGRLFW